jgi:glycosidase
MEKIIIKLSRLERRPVQWAKNRKARMEFHINRNIRIEYGLEDSLFALTGNVVLADLKKTREVAAKFNSRIDPAHPERFIRAGHLYAMGLIDEIMHYVAALYRQQIAPNAFDTCLLRLESKLGETRTGNLLDFFSGQFPPRPVYRGEKTIAEYLNGTEDGENCRALSLEETMFLSLANLNPAFKPFRFLFDDEPLSAHTIYPAAIEEMKIHFKQLPVFGPNGENLWDMLRAPALASPDSLLGQLEYMRKNWGLLISKYMSRLLTSLDVINEEEKPVFFGPGPSQVLSFAGLDEYERFSPDQDWMPQTVLMAKSTLVWLSQLSKKFGREIFRLDQIPDEELDELARRGFTGLWLIGLWERSEASRTIKQWTGNPEAAASAYSLHDYDIAGDLGGWGALTHLRERCIRRGIRLGSDMVPNHTGIDSRWMIEHPDRFLQLPWPPFPTYNYNCGNLSGKDDVTVQIEEHYFSRSDAAVVFKRIDNRSGETRYIYHGNDGTSMPWNDTAQIDFLNPEAREAVIRTIIGVCKQFSIMRFDAAMTLAKRHIQRLWYPVPGCGGAIASRAEHAISNEEFNNRIPNEFWREVVDRCAEEAPNTLLLAEAFWMMEGYFVRTLGMHRVYNSAFMNMLKNEENSKYRATIKNTLEFDPEILKRFVNFMNNPDEDTAVAQFGKGDKYFGICTLLVTMPGLPMFGHGQIEGFEEKYGMEYRRAYRDEQPDGYFVDRHEREIFPLMKTRALFSGSANFRLFDLYTSGGTVNENVFAYSNRAWINGIEERALIIYNNCYYECSGWIKTSDPAIPGTNGVSRDDLCAALGMGRGGSHFVLLREHRSNLWYIRSSKDLSENGFYIALRGYEAQIFLNIHEVEDDQRGRWARLNNDLQGRGVHDPEAAIMNIFLGGLYYRFAEIVRPENINAMRDLLANVALAKSDDVIQFVDTLKAPAQAFFATAAHFMNGADGAYDPWMPLAETDGTAEFTRIDEEAQWKIFSAMVSGILNPTEQAGERLPVCASAVGCGAALGYAALSSLRAVIGSDAGGALAVSLGFDHWKLERKLGEALRNVGAGDGEAAKIIETMRVFLSRTPAAGSLRDKKIDHPGFAAWLIQENYLADDFRKLLGINIFDDVTWFNRENFEDAVRYAVLFGALEMNGQCGHLAKLSDMLLRASTKSEYRFDRLMDIISDNESGPAGNKKPEAKKRSKGK